MSSDSTGPDPLEAQIFMRAIITQRCIQVAICALLVYDVLITVEKEVKHFWTSRWHNVTHIIFFLNRYVGILAATASIFYTALDATTSSCNLHHCKFSIWTKHVGGIFNIIIIDYILVIRVLALWGNNKFLSIILKAIIVCEAIAKLVLVIKADLIADDQAYVFAEGVTICDVGPNAFPQIETLGFINWLIQTVVGFILFALALFQSAKQWKLMHFKGNDLKRVLIRDQIAYYFIVLFCGLINIISYQVTGLSTSNGAYVISILGSPIFLSILGSRMFINLKEAGESNLKVGSGIPARWNPNSTISNLQFAAPHGPQPESVILRSVASSMSMQEV
ncbi:hypothetical protein PNOK_0897800 [Pyrrhoderma noxium]|uniref:DUF6533 domain-containing protein n=1 Tax=Pyrrhoderma noxium TaxID=2282107 RepID=A0A286U6M9_9AGAM|nr:hypothetical protein PNOK_0897800 [Pyrrhoderma noxium]